MFGSLKKKLKSAIEKVSKKLSEEKPEPVPEIKEEAVPEKKEEIIEEKPVEETKKEEKAVKKEEVKEKPVEEEIEPEEKEEIKEEKKEEEEPEEVKEPEKEEIEEEEKKEEKPEPEKEEISEAVKEEKEEVKKEAPIIVEEKEEVREEIKEEKPEKVSRLGRLKKGLVEKFVKKVKEKSLTESDIEDVVKELQVVLLENDVAFSVVEKICDDLKKDLVGKSVGRSKIEGAIKESLKKAMLDVMSQEKIDIEERIEKKYSETKEPLLIIFLGFNGTGKTTNLCKLAYRLKKHKPVLAAGDTFRTASIEQLEEHAKRLGIEIVKHKYGADSAAVIFDAVKHAKATGSKLVLADTAGRSHSNVNLMDELKKVCRVNKPDMKMLVLDSVTGNDIYDQSRLFNEAVGVDAMILTKADVYEKGGAALSASYTIEKPILFLGTGQEYEDLKEFMPEEIVNSLLE